MFQFVFHHNLVHFPWHIHYRDPPEWTSLDHLLDVHRVALRSRIYSGGFAVSFKKNKPIADVDVYITAWVITYCLEKLTFYYCCSTRLWESCWTMKTQRAALLFTTPAGWESLTRWRTCSAWRSHSTRSPSRRNRLYTLQLSKWIKRGTARRTFQMCGTNIMIGISEV